MKRLFLLLVMGLLAVSSVMAQDEEFEIDMEDWNTFDSAEEEGAEGVFLKFMYPEEWLVSADLGEVVIASNEGALEKSNSSEETTPDEGEFLANVILLPTEYLTMFGIEGDDLETITSNLVEFFTSESDEENPTELGEVTMVEFSDELTIGRAPFEMEGIEGVLLVFPLDDELYAVMVGAGYPGELEDYELNLYGIISTLEFTGTMEDLLGQ